MLSLPCITPYDLLAFEEALAKTSSPKEQKQHMKSLLLLATGNKLKALAAQKSMNVITNVSSKLTWISIIFFFIIILGYVWLLESIKEREKMLRKIIFLYLNIMKKDKEKSIKERGGEMLKDFPVHFS